jgi:hypothetical protein
MIAPTLEPWTICLTVNCSGLSQENWERLVRITSTEGPTSRLYDEGGGDEIAIVRDLSFLDGRRLAFRFFVIEDADPRAIVRRMMRVLAHLGLRAGDFEA